MELSNFQVINTTNLKCLWLERLKAEIFNLLRTKLALNITNEKTLEIKK